MASLWNSGRSIHNGEPRKIPVGLEQFGQHGYDANQHFFGGLNSSRRGKVDSPLLVGAISPVSFEHEHDDEHLVAAPPRCISFCNSLHTIS
jgi:hypothetical protein